MGGSSIKLSESGWKDSGRAVMASCTSREQGRVLTSEKRELISAFGGALNRSVRSGGTFWSTSKRRLAKRKRLISISAIGPSPDKRSPKRLSFSLPPRV